MTEDHSPSSLPLFPEPFWWGAATSAYQIEGAPDADGKGPSIWDRFAHTPGRITGGDTGDIACDHYHRTESDLALASDLGLNAYRFSIAWTRIFPEGTGAVNAAGLGFYDRLIDRLLTLGIEPFPTLYHWDLPAALDDHGGWLNRDAAHWFADYAEVLFRAFGDRIRHWTTFNEPWVVAHDGYLSGFLAPGHRNLFEAPRVSHNLLRAHAAAVQLFRTLSPHQIGLVVNLEPKYPASDRPEDLAATARAEAYMNRQYLDPILLGRYPEELVEIFGPAWSDPSGADLDFIRQPIDFVGINYYTRAVTADDPQNPPVRARNVPQSRYPHTETGWEVFAPALTEVLSRVAVRYGNPPVLITENGAAFYDPPHVPAGYQDPLRIAYVRDHLLALRRALAQGIDLRGYFAWSLLDNFEWAHGFSKRFGLIHVDYATQERTIKGSGRFYRDVIQSRGGHLD